MDRSVLVLTAAAGVPDAAVDAAREELPQPAEPLRLADGAVEIGFEGRVPERALALAGIDANVVPASGRRKRLLIADMDSTIIDVECIDELADFAGVKPQVAAITEAAMRGDLDFEGALEARVALLEGLPETTLQRCYDERVRLNPGARIMVRTMAALGADTRLVSGGFTFFSERVAAAAGFAHHQANRLLADAGRLTGRVASPILGREAKRAALEGAVAGLGVGPHDALAIGDGANDLAMIGLAGLGIAWRAKPAVAAAADARLDHSDLTAVLALQGIPEREWRRD
jgi:phosphoserine phosphatase